MNDTPTLEDLEAIDFSAVHSLKALVDCEGVSEENFNDVFFNTFTTVASDLKEVELILGGAEKQVTYANRVEYRDRVIQVRLVPDCVFCVFGTIATLTANEKSTCGTSWSTVDG